MSASGRSLDKIGLRVSLDWPRSDPSCPCPGRSGPAWTSSSAAWFWLWSRPTCWSRRVCWGCWGGRCPGAGGPLSALEASRHTETTDRWEKFYKTKCQLTTISKSSCRFLQLLENCSDVAYSKYHSLFFIRLLNFWGFFSRSAWNLLQIAASLKYWSFDTNDDKLTRLLVGNLF